MDYEIWYTVRCALNVALTLNPRASTATTLADWVHDHGHELGINVLGKFKDKYDRDNKLIELEQWDAVVTAMVEFLSGCTPEATGQLQRILDEVGAELGLSNVEKQVFGAYYRSSEFEPFFELCKALSEGKVLGASELLARMFRVSAQEVDRCLRRNGRLFNLGLLEPSNSVSRDMGGTAHVPQLIRRALLPPNQSVTDFRRALIGDGCASDLAWEDYDHISKERNFALNILRNATRCHEKGINILLYGSPGTGKTEFAKVLAGRLGVPCYSVGEYDEEGADPSTKERIASLRLANALISGKSQALLLFDEMEDLGTDYGSLFGKRSGSPSKVFLNRLLETNPIPTIWTTNDIHCFEPAMRRRITYAIEMRVPPRRMRERVWHKLLEKESLSLDAKGIAELAREFPESPALAANAVRAAKLAGGDEKQIRQAVQSVATLIHGKRPKPRNSQKAPYELGLLNADLDLQKLTTRICGLENVRRVSFCLSGAPGTGKSAYVRYLADRMGLEVLHKRTSDLLSMWVGGSEKNIADAFREAREEEAFLVFDEADSLLRDRSCAQRSWEVSQVNEMLTWMESHDYPFACTTNFKEGLDPASLRRFTFKVNFGFLNARQCEAAFRLYFDIESPAGLARLWNLTPGDFAVARRKAEVLGCLKDAGELLELLQDESLAKSGNQPMGFRTA